MWHYASEDFIAIVRDQEEILFAPVSKTIKPTTAIVSEIEPMIEIIGSMIADYWRVHAKKIK